MSVVGVDLGNMSTVVAVARNRGIDVITNETSNRTTPSLVAFGTSKRVMGEAAKVQAVFNYKNTVGSLKRLIGRSLKEPDVQIEQQYIDAPLVEVNGEVGVEVNYLGNKEKFSATQLLAMFMNSIKMMTAANTRAPVDQLVMSVPAWFTDRQRRSLDSALDIIGISPQRLLNDTTAAALGYGITKTDLPTGDEKPRRVMFVDIGHSTYTASVVEFRKGELAVKSTAFDRHYGGRDFDRALLEHFRNEIMADKSLGNVDINLPRFARPRMRLLNAIEDCKKILSANSFNKLTVEIHDSLELTRTIQRQDFEAMTEALLNRTTAPLVQALADAGLTKDDIDIIEVIGGCTRIPAIKQRIQEFFGKPLSFTLNQDEAIARGCAFASALMSPTFRAREFAVHDIISYPIEFIWEKANDIPDEEPNLVVFGKGNTMPSTKVLTFFRKRPFDLEARYFTPQDLPVGMNPWIARFSVKGVKPTISGPDDYMTCKLRARINPSGILNLDSAYYVEEQEVEEEIKEEEKKDEAGEAMDTDASKEEKPKTRKVRKQVRKDNLPVVSATLALDRNLVEDAREKEGQMAASDKLATETEEFKNSMETSLYELRNKLESGAYTVVVSKADQDKALAKVEEAIDWVHGDDFFDATLAICRAKKEGVDAVMGPIQQRYFEYTEGERKKREAEAAKKAAEEAAAKEAAAGNSSSGEGAGDADMTDADAPKPTVEDVD